MILIININNNSFSARPKESICLYDEHILDNELLVVACRISKIVDHLGEIQGKSENETGLRTGEICNLELQNKETTNQLENYFRDIEVKL